MVAGCSVKTNKSKTNPTIEAIPFKSFKEKIRIVKSMLKVGKVEIFNEANIILVIRRED